MKPKVNNIEFIAFEDGICDIYIQDDDNVEPDYKYKRLGFSKKVLSYNRYFASNSVNSKISKVISIPLVSGIDAHDTVKIDNVEYDLILAQEIYTSNPPSITLSLEKKE